MGKEWSHSGLSLRGWRGLDGRAPLEVQGSGQDVRTDFSARTQNSARETRALHDGRRQLDAGPHQHFHDVVQGDPAGHAATGGIHQGGHFLLF